MPGQMPPPLKGSISETSAAHLLDEEEVEALQAKQEEQTRAEREHPEAEKQ